jgi:hypothetical protein
MLDAFLSQLAKFVSQKLEADPHAIRHDTVDEFAKKIQEELANVTETISDFKVVLGDEHDSMKDDFFSKIEDLQKRLENLQSKMSGNDIIFRALKTSAELQKLLCGGFLSQQEIEDKSNAKNTKDLFEQLKKTEFLDDEEVRIKNDNKLQLLAKQILHLAKKSAFGGKLVESLSLLLRNSGENSKAEIKSELDKKNSELISDLNEWERALLQLLGLLNAVKASVIPDDMFDEFEISSFTCGILLCYFDFN